MKKDMTLIRSWVFQYFLVILLLIVRYTSGTGGGKDPAMEALVAKHESPSEADSLLMSLLKNTVGAFGVGDIMLETGHVGIHSYWNKYCIYSRKWELRRRMEMTRSRNWTIMINQERAWFSTRFVISIEFISNQTIEEKEGKDHGGRTELVHV